MITLPCSEDIAVALCAACKETGEDPRDFGPNGKGATQARHYALHALVHVFPKVSKLKLCAWVGCPGSPSSFWSISWHIAIGKRRAAWFRDEAYDRVIRAIEAARTRRAIAPPQTPAAISVRPMAPARPPHPQIADIEEAIAGDRPVMDRTGFTSRKPRIDFLPSSKAEIYEELRRAAANTPPRGE